MSVNGAYIRVQGTDKAVQAAEEKTLIAAQGANTKIRVLRGFVTVELAATGAGVGNVALEDRSTFPLPLIV